MNESPSRSQVSFGIILGVLLQPLSLLMVLAFIHATAHDSEARGWGSMGAVLLYGFYFGMAQVLTILPASLLLLLAGKHGTVRGLLNVGTVLALVNVVILVVKYAVLPHSVLMP
jgi:hypothetical protein